MGKLQLFDIVIDNQLPVYFGGENLSGLISIKVSERLKINKVTFSLIGYADVYWTESHSSNGQSSTTTYYAKEDFINQVVVFLQKKANEDLYLEVGDHQFPFQAQLPNNLPTSFEHAIGRVRYLVKSTLDIPWSFDKHVERRFSVMSHNDLNINPTLRQPNQVQASKVLCCGPCASDPITATFGLPKTGYVPGEFIFFNVQIDNKSSRDLNRLSVSLVEQIKFHSTSKTRTDTRIVIKAVYPNKILQETVETWNHSFQIPPLIASSNGLCKIIEINYLMILTLTTSGVSFNKEIPIYIHIGTIPLFDQNNNKNQSISISQPQRQQPIFQTSLFEPANTINQNAANAKGETIQLDANSFKPLYPVYTDFSNNNLNIQ